MRRTAKLFQVQTAGDVMNRAGVVLPHGMSVVAAARLLLEEQLRAAPVTDDPGRCIGVLSAADFIRWAADGGRADEEDGALAASVWCDWQVVEEKSPQRDEVRRYMTRDPLLVTADTRLAEIADVFLDPRRRPVVVVDEARRPLGVVSSTDLLGALASVDRGPEAEPPAVAPANRRVLLRRLAQPSGTA
jgi:CBS domain-containing protein